MRELKFRAYWNPGKIMIQSENIESINFETKVLGIYHPIGNIGFHRLRMSDFEIMQWTDLKDCNGKDIYEGDIVKRLNWEYAYIVKHDDERTGFYYHDHSNLDDDHMSMIMSRENLCEVIGNIFENPELLEAKA